MSGGGQQQQRSSLWDGKVHEWLVLVELNTILPSFAFFAVALVVAIIFGVPWIGSLNVWPAYGWIYLLIVLVLYALMIWTIHNTASLTTLAVNTLALSLILLTHAYCATTLIAWLVMQPIGLVPVKSQREFSYVVHAILAIVHIFRMVHDFTGIRLLINASQEVRKRRRAARRGTAGLENVNGSDAEEEMDDM